VLHGNHSLPPREHESTIASATSPGNKKTDTSKFLLFQTPPELLKRGDLLQINFQWHGEYGNKNEWGGEECSKK